MKQSYRICIFLKITCRAPYKNGTGTLFKKKKRLLRSNILRNCGTGTVRYRSYIQLPSSKIRIQYHFLFIFSDMENVSVIFNIYLQIMYDMPSYLKDQEMKKVRTH